MTKLVFMSSSFNPLKISGGSTNLVFWTTADGLTAGTQSQLLDISGNANHTAVQGTSTARMTAVANQLNGKTILSADGGDYYTLPSALYTIPNGSYTYFVTSKVNTEATGTVQTALSFREGANNRFSLRYSATVAGTVTAVQGPGNAAITGVAGTSYGVYTVTRNSIDITLRVNGGTNGTDNDATSYASIDAGFIGATSGGNQNMTGGIAEILIYNRLLTSSEMLQVEVYLANKWGIYHPYAS